MQVVLRPRPEQGVAYLFVEGVFWRALSLPLVRRERLREQMDLDEGDLERLWASELALRAARRTPRHTAAFAPGTSLTLTKRQPTRRGLVALFFDGTFRFSVPPACAETLRVGEVYTEDALNALVDEGEIDRARRYLQVLAERYRPRGVAEAAERLRHRGYAEPVIAVVLARGQEQGWLSDAVAAEALINAARARGKGPRLIAALLRQKGLPVTVGEDAEALEHARRKARRGLNLTVYRDRERYLQRLLAAGFSSPQVRTALAQDQEEVAAQPPAPSARAARPPTSPASRPPQALADLRRRAARGLNLDDPHDRRTYLGRLSRAGLTYAQAQVGLAVSGEDGDEAEIVT